MVCARVQFAFPEEPFNFDSNSKGGSEAEQGFLRTNERTENTRSQKSHALNSHGQRSQTRSDHDQEVRAFFLCRFPLPKCCSFHLRRPAVDERKPARDSVRTPLGDALVFGFTCLPLALPVGPLLPVDDIAGPLRPAATAA